MREKLNIPDILPVYTIDGDGANDRMTQSPGGNGMAAHLFPDFGMLSETGTAPRGQNFVLIEEIVATPSTKSAPLPPLGFLPTMHC